MTRRKMSDTRGAIRRIIHDLRLLKAEIGDYHAGRYRKVPFWSLAGIALPILYAINPLDFLPDYIPFIGALDDIAVLGLSLKLIERDLERYARWQEKREGREKI